MATTTKRLVEKTSGQYFYPALHMGTMDSGDTTAVVNPPQIRTWVTGNFLSTQISDSTQELQSPITFKGSPLILDFDNQLNNQVSLYYSSENPKSFVLESSSLPIQIDIQSKTLKLEPVAAGILLATNQVEANKIILRDGNDSMSAVFESGNLVLEDAFNLDISASNIKINAEGDSGIVFNSDNGYIFSMKADTTKKSVLKYYQKDSTSGRSVLETSETLWLQTEEGNIWIVPESYTYIKKFRYSLSGTQGAGVGSSSSTTFQPIYFSSAGDPSTGWTFNLSNPAS